MKDVLVIIPAYNESGSIGQVIDSVQQHSPFADIVVINDASTDNTAQVADERGILVLTHPTNLGIGGTVQTGYRYAAQKAYSWTVVVDGDGQHDPRYITELLTPLKSGEYDCVIGSRYIKKTEYKTPWTRRLGMVLFSNLLAFLIGKRIADTTSGFRALNQKATNFFAREFPVDFPDAEALLTLHRNGMRIVEIPVEMHPRIHGISHYGFMQSLNYPFKSLIAILAVLLRGHRLKNS